MKAHYWIIIAALFASLAIFGCSKKETVNTAPLEQSFQSAEPSMQTSANKAVAAVKAGDYGAAVTELKTLAENAKLTPDQKQAIQDIMAQIQAKISETAQKAANEAGKTMDNLKNSLPK